MRIPESSIEEVRAAADIVDVVSDYVRLKKRGSNFVGLCPFHTEKTPSFNVNPARGIFKCFGCGAGGDVFQFVTRIEAISFPEAVRMLAESLGVTLPEESEQDPAASENEAIYHALRFAGRFFYRQLTGTEDGRTARDYLAGRGVQPAMVKRFAIGYAPDAWDGLLKEALAAGLKEDILLKAGLILTRKDGSGYYDRYRHRLIFPILSHVGKVLGFGGRILVADKTQPKYVNSPETAVYHKSRVLYGLYQAKQSVRAKEEAVLVEGYTDVVALHQAGVTNVVASSGTALTPDQVRLLSRYAKRVVLLYDADDAGVKATVRGIDLLLAAGMAPYIVRLPDGEDPDSFAGAQGGEAFEAFLEERRMDFVEYLHDLARRRGALERPDSRAAVQHAVVKSIGAISDPLTRESYLQRASDVLEVPDVFLRRALDSNDRRPSRRARRQEREPAPPPAATSPVVPAPRILPEEKTLLRLMLEGGPEIVEFVLTRVALDEFSEGASRELAAGLVAQYQDGALNAQPFLAGAFGEEVQELASELLVDPAEPSENWTRMRQITVPRLNEDPRGAAASAMTLLKLDRLDGMIAALRRQLFEAEQEGADIRPLQEELLEMQRFRKQIEERQFLAE